VTQPRVLIAEDYPEYGSAIREAVLKLCPSAIIDETNYPDVALSFLKKNPYNLVITDYELDPSRDENAFPEYKNHIEDRKSVPSVPEYNWGEIDFDSTQTYGGGQLIRYIRNNKTMQAANTPIILQSSNVNETALEFLMRPRFLGAQNNTAFIHKETFGATDGIAIPVPVLHPEKPQKDVLIYLAAPRNPDINNRTPRPLPDCLKGSQMEARKNISPERLQEALLKALSLLGLDPVSLTSTKKRDIGETGYQR